MIDFPSLDRIRSTFAARTLLAVSLVFVSSCGTQINSLRNAARITAGAEGVPPGLVSFVINEGSPTKSFPLNFSYGLEVGTHTQYCLLENGTNPNTCIWRTGALPATYFDSSADGPLTMTLFLKNANGISDPVTSNTVTIDRTPPALSSATVTNSDPTNDPVFSIAWGAVTGGSYDDYCILENNTSVAACSWQSGTLPPSYTVTSTNGPKTLYVWLRDAAGNVSFPVNTTAVTLNLTVPTVAFTSPAAGSFVTAANAASFAVSGTCSENGRNVVISGAASATVVCAGGAWSTTLNLTAAADGSVTLYADHSNSAGTSAVQASRSFVKDVVVPTVAITSPAAGSAVNNANKAAFAISGTCSENGRNVVLSGAGSGTVTCSGGTWSTTLDLSAAADGVVTVYADHSDAAGNPAVQASRSFVKDVVVPTVAITSPAAGSAVNNANKAAFAISGTCSENGRNVVLSGAGSGTVTCSGGTWSTTLDLSAAADGVVTVYADHSDAAGNPAVQASRTFNKDVVPPTVAITAPAAGSLIGSANVASFAVSGTCSENGANVVLTGDASATVTCLAGTWNATLDFSSAADGSVTILANHADAAGNNAVQDSRTFTKDTGAPTVAITSPTAGTWVDYDSQTSFTVSGTCSENGRNVVLSGAGAATVACSAGTWSATLDVSAASDGAITIYADHSDAAGNNAVQASRAFNKDTVLPTMSLLTPTASGILLSGGSTYNITWSASDAGSGVDHVAIYYSTDGGANYSNLIVVGAPNTGSYSWTVPSIDTTSARVRLNVYDLAGNKQVQMSANDFTIDSSVPTVAITAPPAGSTVNNANKTAFAVSGTCSENGRNVVLSGAGSATVACSGGTWSANLNVSAAGDGTITVYADHSDASGNNAVQDSRTFTKDTVNPTVAITSPLAGASIYTVNMTTFAVSGNCSENGRSVVLSGAASGSATCSGGTWSTTLDFSGASDGTVTLYADLADAAGNNAVQDSRTFTKDTGIPTLTIATPPAGSYVNATNVASFTVTGTCSENGQNVVISGDAAATVACAAGAWTANLDFTSAAAGTVSITVNHSDTAGNAANPQTRNFTKDVTPPTVAITAPAANSYFNSNVALISGTCSETGQNVVISDGHLSASGACTAGHTFSLNLNIGSSSEGAFTVTADHSDAAGNAAPQDSRAFIKDTVAPAVTLGAPTGGSGAGGAAVTISWTSSDLHFGGTPVDLYWSTDGFTTQTLIAAGQVANGSYNWNYPSVNTNIQVRVYATDLATNQSYDTSANILIDSTPPTVVINSPAANAYVNQANASAFTVSGTCSENGRAVSVSAASGAITASPTCTAGAWSTSLNIASELDYGLAPQSTGLVRLYHLNDALGSGSVVDSSPVGVNGTPGAGVTLGGAGKLKTLATFNGNGTNGKITGGTTGLPLGNSPRSVTFWVNPTSLPAAAGHASVVAWGTGTTDTGYFVGIKNVSGTISVEQGGVFDDHVIPYAVPTGAWTFIAATYDGTTSSISINGGAPVTESHPSWNTASGALNVAGASWSTLFPLVGALDEVAIWNVALTPAQITAIYNSQSGTYFADGAFTVTADHSDAVGNAAPQDSRSFIKDTVAPVVAISSPAAGSFVNNSNVTSFAVSGTCTENGVNVVLSGDASKSISCSGGAWSTTVDFSGAADGTVTLTSTQTDTAGNSLARSRTFTKDTSAPTVAITSPTSGSALNIQNANAFAVSGTCSENGRTVSVAGASGAWSATPTCSSGNWSTTFKAAVELDGYIAPAGSNLVAAYHLNESSGAGAVIDAIAAKNGVPGAGVTLGGSGQISTKAAFNGNGTNGKIDVATNAAPTGNTARTVTMWIKASSLPGVGAQQCMVGWGVQAAEQAQMLCLYNNGGTQTIEYGGMSDDFYMPYTVPTNSWVFIAFTFDGTNAGISVNGAAPTYDSHPLWNTGAGSFTIGGLSWLPCCGFVGDLDEIGVWNTALTPAQIATVYAYQSGAYFADGAFSVTADLTDASGNPAPQASQNFVKDTVRPTLTFTSPAAGTFITPANVSSFPMTGTCSESGWGITVYFNGVFQGGISCTAGAWSYNANFSGEAEGNVVVKIGQSDAAGNGAYPQPTITFVKDTTVPTVTITSPSAGAYVTAANQAAFTVSGACTENGQNVVLSGAASATVSCSGGTWSKTLDLTALGQGAFTIKADHSDAAGNAAVQATISYTKDTVAPTLAFSTPAAMTSANLSTYTSFPVTGTCTENGINVVISGAVSTTAACSGGTWSANLNLGSLGQGTFTVKIDQTDAAGNAATQQTRNFDLDTLPPNAANPVAWSVPGPTNSTSLTAAWTKSNSGDFANEKIQFYADGTCTTASGGLIDLASNTLQTRAFTAPGEGSFSYVLTSFDAAGNSTASACSTAIVVDQTAPAAPTGLSWQYGALTNHATQNLNWTLSVSGDVVDQYVRFYQDGTCTTALGGWFDLSSATQTYSNRTAPADGTYSAKVRAVDAAGNQTDSACSPSSTLDTVVPTLASATITNGTPTSSQTFGLSYGAITDSYTRYCIRENNTAVGGCSWTAGTLPASFNVADVNEAKTLSVWIQDGAGNVSTRVDTNTVTYNNGIVLSPLTSTATATTSSNSITGTRALVTTIQLASGDLLAVGGTSSTSDANLITNSVIKFKTGYTAGNHTWSSLAPMITPRMLPGVVELANGNILAIGGCTILPYYSSNGTAATEVYVPADNRWYRRANMNTARCYHTTTLLNNGKVLVVGGWDSTGATLGTYELYDPVADSWTQGTFNGGATLAGLSATKLSDGRVFLAGGFGSAGWNQSLTLMYDQGTNTFTAKANMNAGRQTHSAVLLTSAETGASGDTVMVFGGYAGGYLSSVEAYDVTSNTWTTKASMANARTDYPSYAVNVGGGKVYVVGGTNGTPMTAVERYTWSSNTWSNRSSLPSSQANQILGRLGDGFIISAGGVTTDSSNNSTSPFVFEIDPTANTTTTGINFPLNVQNAASVTLNDGRVLTCGGYSVGEGTLVPGCLTFDPTVNGFAGVGKLSYARQGVRMIKLGNGMVAMAGGLYGASNSNVLQIFNPTTNTISTGANIPAPTYNPATFALSGNKLLYAGGLSASYGTATTAAYIYDYDTNGWTAAASMPGAVGNAAYAKTPSGKMYVHGGYANVSGTDTYYNTLYQYNEAGNTWSTLASSTSVRGWHTLTAYTVGASEYLLAAGGEQAINFGTVLRSAEKYDITANTWASAGNMPGTTNGKKAIHAAYFPAGSNNVFEFGGYGGDQSAVYAYSISGNSWSTKTAMNTTQYNSFISSVPLLDGRMFVYCGMYGNDYSKPVDLYNLTTPVVYTATGSNNNLVFSLTSGAGTLYEKIRTFIPPFPLTGGPSRVTVTDGNGHSVSADVNY
ncbi:MAG: hypothetical protein JST04_04165 [Bdellovibrionales bacterium]|nr:hypothetical protein [Bdellovibrionales bacterium]